MPRTVYLMALGIFAMVTSEFLVGGLMPQIAADLGVSIARVGYLVTAFGLAMAVGGPIVATALIRLAPKSALLVLFAVFTAGNALAAMAPDYPVMLAARVVTGAASGAFFGVAITAVVRLVPEGMRGRATGVAMQGLMIGTLLGLPLSTLLGGLWGWRAAFGAVGVLAVAAALAVLASMPRLAPAEDTGGLRDEAAVFRRPRLLAALLGSTLIIGATFSAFTYFTPILTEVTGFSEGAVPVLLLVYGAASVAGNAVVARFAQSHTRTAIAAGLALNALFLAGFALFAGLKAPAVAAMIGIGLVGVTLNPAMAMRVHREGNARALVNTVHSSFITMGVVLGSWLGGMGIDAYGLRAAPAVGVALAAAGLLTLVPDLLRARGGRSGEDTAPGGAPGGAAPAEPVTAPGA
ncbi:MFS transporter [Nocardiopsis composta]|uniref:Putative MFS family arabinose efflux permease n=1 Tax=Nocardiopsis composta TaxID=157465 RepID=A0A7W8VFS6_9ACTN|nr:MFS transporter [Nocardiopsis composta]MBB5434425.1 putative MFS family arabinose efflux permease [Nocardiopsis composta]